MLAPNGRVSEENEIETGSTVPSRSVFAAGTLAMELGYKTPKQITTSLQSLLHCASMVIVRSAKESPHLSAVTHDLTLKLHRRLRDVPDNRVDPIATTLATALSACLHGWILDPQAFEQRKQSADAFIASVDADA